MLPCLTRKLVAGIGLAFCLTCTYKPEVGSIVKAFFDEVGKSNFETAKAGYLSATLKNAIDSSTLMKHKAIQECFGQFAGHIKSVEIQSVQVKGQAASVFVLIDTTWGSKAQGAMALIEEEGKTWRINDWSEFKTLGSEHIARAVGLCELGNLKAALDEFHAALAENPTDSATYTTIGECYLKVGNYAAAEDQFRTAISMYPDVVWEPYIALANLLQNRADVPSAEQAYKKAIKNRPDYWVPYNNLAYLYADRGRNLDEAIELAQRAVSLSPDEAASLDTLGWAYYKKGDRTQALKYLARALAKLPRNKEVLAHYRAASKP